jgi:ATP-dependent Lon protease
VNYIQPLEQNHQSFDNLVLKSEHKQLVQSLVKTHSTGMKPTSDAVGRSENNTREDLVRGKGKGVIILLHGVPGVGKSNTAECVAEYTKRPPLSVTCGQSIFRSRSKALWCMPLT